MPSWTKSAVSECSLTSTHVGLQDAKTGMKFIHFTLEAVRKRCAVILEVAILYFCRQTNLNHIKLVLAVARKQRWLKLIEQVKDFKCFIGISYVQNISLNNFDESLTNTFYSQGMNLFYHSCTSLLWVFFLLRNWNLEYMFFIRKQSYINITFDVLVQYTCFVIKSHATMLCSKNLYCLGNILLWGVANCTIKLSRSHVSRLCLASVKWIDH